MKRHIRFTPTGAREPAGFRVFQFTAYDEDGAELGRFSGRSGLAPHQKLRRADDEAAKPGSAEPLPEGIYSIGWPEYQKSHENWPVGLSGRWMSLNPKPGYKLIGGRKYFGLHPDGAAPGSLGCAVTYSNAAWEEIANWVRDLGFDTLIVDHGLGLVPSLEAKPEAVPTAKVRLNGDLIGEAFIFEGKTVPTLATLAKLLKLSPAWDSKTKTVDLQSG